MTGAAEYLELVNDPLGEFCGQHHVTATPAGSVLMFDNGNHCLGPYRATTVRRRRPAGPNTWRLSAHHVTATLEGSVLMFDKDLTPVTRIAEYDISSGTEARFVREYRLPEADGFAASGGGVTELENGNWLITWGNNGPNIAVSEVDPAGNEIFRMRMTKDGDQYGTGRVYRERESDLAIPLNLP